MMAKLHIDRHRLFRVLARVWIITLTILMLLPGKSIPVVRWALNIPIDKTIHFLSFFFLAAGFLLGYRWEDRSKRRILFVELLVYASIMEVIQHLLQPSRAFEMADMLANILGIITAFIGYYVLGKFIKKLTLNPPN